MSTLKGYIDKIIQEQNVLPINRLAGFTLQVCQETANNINKVIGREGSNLKGVVGRIERPSLSSLVLAADIVPCVTDALVNSRSKLNVVTKALDISLKSEINDQLPMYAVSSMPVCVDGSLAAIHMETWFVQNMEIVAYSEILYFLVNENLKVKKLIDKKSKNPIENELPLDIDGNQDYLKTLGIRKKEGVWQLEINKNCASVYPGIVHGAAMMCLSIAGKNIKECHFDIKKAPNSKGVLVCEDMEGYSYVKDKEGTVYLSLKYS